MHRGSDFENRLAIALAIRVDAASTMAGLTERGLRRRYLLEESDTDRSCQGRDCESQSNRLFDSHGSSIQVVPEAPESLRKA